MLLQSHRKDLRAALGAGVSVLGGWRCRRPAVPYREGERLVLEPLGQGSLLELVSAWERVLVTENVKEFRRVPNLSVQSW